MGTSVKHRSRVAKDPTRPNLRQVHLIHSELFDELRAAGFRVGPGDMGENVTTRGVDLLSLPAGTRLHLGPEAVVEVTGLRNPCRQLDDFQTGLMAAVLDRDPDGNLIRKAGIMGSRSRWDRRARRSDTNRGACSSSPSVAAGLTGQKRSKNQLGSGPLAVIVADHFETRS